MTPPITPVVTENPPRNWTLLGVLLLAIGLSGHLLAARAIGGYYIAYRDHIAGFVMATIVTGVLVWAIGRRFWKGRTDITILIVGILQTLFGIFVYIVRFHIA
jgi:uncharacterized membrane protein (UPF0136 family)